MRLEFEKYNNESEELLEFLTAQRWEYYGTQVPNRERLKNSIEKGYYSGEDIESFWIVNEDGNKIGILRIYDLEDPTPLFDIRIKEGYEGRGIGTIAIKWLNDHIFRSYNHVIRIEGNTRVDNYGMRCVFHKSGYVKESHHRNAWPCQNGEVYDSVGYGITREDWESGKVTPLVWKDFKC